jgi:hypothetical protein
MPGAMAEAFVWEEEALHMRRTVSFTTILASLWAPVSCS